MQGNAGSKKIWPENAANRQTLGGGVARSASQTPQGTLLLPAWGVWTGVRGLFPIHLRRG